MIDDQGFTEEQQQYLQGFLGGALLGRSLRGQDPAAASQTAAPAAGAGPDQLMHAAQARVTSAGGKLVPEEQAKQRRHPLDMWSEIEQHGREGRFPKGSDVLAFKYHGLFYVAPAQSSYMCRLRFPGGVVPARRLHDLAGLSEHFAGGFADVTTRANLQLREIQAAAAAELLVELQDAGICSRGSGADNIRNITGPPAAGFDPDELIDTRPIIRQLHHLILNSRELYGLPRKFNIAFDGGGSAGVLEETNDIGFAAVRVPEGAAAPAGIYFRMLLGGITGHRDFARDTGLLLKPEQCVPAAVAAVKVFIAHGDRTDRKKARLKYLLDRWGLDRFIAECEDLLDWKPLRLPLDQCDARIPVDRLAHLGAHPQRQPERWYLGVALPVGRLQADQMRGLARIAEQYGDGEIRLTVWQNLLVPGIHQDNLQKVQAEIEGLGLDWRPDALRGGLVACTGRTGCRFAAADTKGDALRIAERLTGRVELDQPINIHLTGCHHSCAQHFIGDIGLQATTVTRGEESLEGYHLCLGGGWGSDQAIAREILRDVTAAELPDLVEALLKLYQERRAGPEESFSAWARRHPEEELRRLLGSGQEGAAS